MLSSYLLNLKRGPVAVRKMIVSDIRAAIDLGASEYAADLVLVLRMFLSKHLEARISQRTPYMNNRASVTCGIDPRYPVAVRFVPRGRSRDI